MSNSNADASNPPLQRRVTLQYGNVSSATTMWDIQSLYGLGSSHVDGIQVNPNYGIPIGAGYGLSQDGSDASYGTCPNLPLGLPQSLKKLGSGGITGMTIWRSGSGPIVGLKITTTNGDPFEVGDTSGTPLIHLPDIRVLFMGFHGSSGSDSKVDGIAIDLIEEWKEPQLIASAQKVILTNHVAGSGYPHFDDSGMDRIAGAITLLNHAYRGSHLNASMLISWIDRVGRTLFYNHTDNYKQAAVEAAVNHVGATPDKRVVPADQVMVYSAQEMDLYQSGDLFWFTPTINVSNGGRYELIPASVTGLDYQGFYDLSETPLSQRLSGLSDYKTSKNGWTYYSHTKQS